MIRPKIPAAANKPGRVTWQSGFGFLQLLMWPASAPMPMRRSTSATAKQILHQPSFQLIDAMKLLINIVEIVKLR